MPGSGYTAITFVASEQPTTAKWNLIGSNFASLVNGNGFDDDFIIKRHIADDQIDSSHVDWDETTGKIWWEELGRTTLSSNATSMTISSLPNKKYLKLLLSIIPNGGNTSVDLSFNGDNGASAYGYGVGSGAGAADGTATTSRIVFDTNISAFGTLAADIVNVATREKTVIGTMIDNSAVGTANIPARRTVYGKWGNTASVISSVTISTTSNNYGAGSELIILGHN